MSDLFHAKVPRSPRSSPRAAAATFVAARAITRQLVEEGDLAGGALLVAELALTVLAAQGEESLGDVVRQLNLQLMSLPLRAG